MNSPLVDLAISDYYERGVFFQASDLSRVKLLLQAYLNSVVSFRVCESSLRTIVDDTKPLERLQKILAASSEPVPEPGNTGKDEGGAARKKTRVWTVAEDQRLLLGIHKFGLERWSLVAKFVGGSRTRSQCSQRWLRVLSPSISRLSWKSEDEDRLVRLVMHYGKKSWVKIASEFGNRSDVQCRYKYKQMEKANDPRILNQIVPVKPVTAQCPVAAALSISGTRKSQNCHRNRIAKLKKASNPRSERPAEPQSVLSSIENSSEIFKHECLMDFRL